MTALYTVDLGKRHVVDSVTVTGNKYFGTQLITQRLSVRPNSFLDRYGAFSQQLVAQDVCQHQGALPEQRLQRGHGHDQIYGQRYQRRESAARSPTSKSTTSSTKGTQRRIGKYDIEGATRGATE